MVYGNANGISANGLIAGNAVYGTNAQNLGGIGINAGAAAVVRGNTVYGQTIGIRVANGSGADVLNNVVYANSSTGIEVGNSTNTDIINNTVYQLVGNAIFLNGTTSGTVLTNNIIVALNALGVVVANSAQAGFASGFNIFQVGPGGQAGNGRAPTGSRWPRGDWPASRTPQASKAIRSCRSGWCGQCAGLRFARLDGRDDDSM